MRGLGINWQRSIYAGALLSQIGEFSFILAAVGLSASMITEFDYQITIGVISIALFISPFWIIMIKSIADKKFK